MTPEPASLPESCPNCGASVSGNYCAQCGQKRGGVHVTLGAIGHELVDEFFHLDAKILQTLKPLFLRPGLLTVEYWSGKRARFMRPVQLYLAAAFLFFFAASFVKPDSVILDVRGDPEVSDALKERKSTRSAFETKMESYVHSHDQKQMQKDILGSIQEWFPRVMFLAIPFFALLCALLFRKSGRFYAEHFVFALHLHAFVFLFALLRLPLPQTLGALLLLVLPVYLGVALRRVYGGGSGGGSMLGTVLKTFALGAVYLGVLAVAVGGIVIGRMYGIL